MRFVVLGVFSMFASLPAFAWAGGPPSGHSGETVSCTQCHGVNAPAPTISVTGLDGLVADGVAHIVVTVTRVGDTTDSLNACAGTRCAGFQASTDTAGDFVVTEAAGTKLTNALAKHDNEIEHNARRPFGADGTVTFSFDLTNLQSGDHTLFVAANDVNGNLTFTGDRVGTDTFPFTVTGENAGEGEGEGEGEGAGEGEGEGEGGGGGGGGGGCASTTPATAGALALGLVLLRRRRR